MGWLSRLSRGGLRERDGEVGGAMGWLSRLARGGLRSAGALTWGRG